MSTRYKITPRDWAKYNDAKVQEGNIFIHFAPDIEEYWYANNHNVNRGKDQIYSDACIELILGIRFLLKLRLRQTQGFIMGLLDVMNLNLRTPNYSTLSRRAKDLPIIFRQSDLADNLHIAVDATGVGVYTEQEWNTHKHGKKSQRKWRKLSILINAKTGEILANTLATSHDSDSYQVAPLLAQLPDMIEGLYGDGAYDKDKTFDAIKAHQEFPVDIIVPPIETLGIPEDPTQPLSRRQQHRQYIDQYGKDRWRSKTKYGRREKVEGTFARLKTIFGEKLLSQDKSVQQTEIDIKCKILNQFNTLYTDGFIQQMA